MLFQKRVHWNTCQNTCTSSPLAVSFSWWVLGACACRQTLLCKQLWHSQAYGTPLDDWTWNLTFLVGKGGFRHAPKRLPVWHHDQLRLEGLARVGQNHWCRFPCVFQSSCLAWRFQPDERGVVRQCWCTADTLCQSHIFEESFDSPRVCTCRTNCFLSFPLPPSSMSCPLLSAAHRPDREESSECGISVTCTNWQKKSVLLACYRTSSRCSRSDVQLGPRRCACCRNALETTRKNFRPWSPATAKVRRWSSEIPKRLKNRLMWKGEKKPRNRTTFPEVNRT